jgi:hypothetical protein
MGPIQARLGYGVVIVCKANTKARAVERGLHYLWWHVAKQFCAALRFGSRYTIQCAFGGRISGALGGSDSLQHLFFVQQRSRHSPRVDAKRDHEQARLGTRQGAQVG